ncbi:unnamed protein product [Merluccius merluccius]
MRAKLFSRPFHIFTVYNVPGPKVPLLSLPISSGVWARGSEDALGNQARGHRGKSPSFSSLPSSYKTRFRPPSAGLSGRSQPSSSSSPPPPRRGVNKWRHTKSGMCTRHVRSVFPRDAPAAATGPSVT